MSVFIMYLRLFLPGLVLIPFMIFSQPLQVVTVFPPQNDNTASTNTEIRVDFNLPIDTAGIGGQFVVMGNMNGLYPVGVSVEPSLQSVVLQPAAPFFIGERVNVTARSTLGGSGGENFEGFNWQFTIKPTLPTPPIFGDPLIFNQFGGYYGAVMFPSDVNKDGHIDLIIISTWIQVALNDGQGNFTLHQEIYNSPWPNPDISTTDLDLDGAMEIIAASGFFELDNDGYFHFVNYIDTLVVDTRDMNRDGYPDLITTEYLGNNQNLVGVLYNDGGGHFPAIDTLLIDEMVADAVVGDFNNDGINDIAYVTQLFAIPGGTGGHNSLRVIYMSSNGDTLYRNIYNEEDFPLQYLGFPSQVSTVDFNNDGFLDMFIGTNSVDYISLNDTQGGFLTNTALEVGGGDSYHWTTYGDITANSGIDLVSSAHIPFGFGGTSAYMRNDNGIFNFGQILEERFDALPFITISADYTNDGAQDIATLWNDALHIQINDESQGITPGLQNLPSRFILYQNFPNPFNGETVTRFYLSQNSFVESTIYDLNGKEVKRYLKQWYPAGEGRLSWDGKNNEGREVSSGLYVWKFKSQGGEKTIKLILIR